MPEISLIPEVYYTADQPYHFHYDNLPLKNILDRIDLVNSQVDINTSNLRGSGGTVGSLKNRLNVSLNSNGSIKASAVNNSLHNIAYHEDGEDGDGIAYVRMLATERDKLNLIQSEANSLDVEFETISTTAVFSSGTIRFRSSDTVQFSVQAPDIVKIHSAFPANAAHQHYYDVTPAHKTPSQPDYKNYKTTSVNTPYISGSLRVYVNGIRLSSTGQVRVPDISTADTWTLTYVSSETPASGLFTLNRALTSSDVVRIDFDQDFT